MNETTTENSNALVPAAANNADIRSLVYVIRGQQVMLDSDLAFLYQVETGALNRAMKRNTGRFPEDFCFQLTKDEYENLKCQIGISSENSYGGRRTLPYAFTEQGISMLASVLHSDVAVQASIKIMRAFVEMRRFISNNALLFERISCIELKQLEYQKSTDERFNRVFQYIDDHAESEQKIFFDGQISDFGRKDSLSYRCFPEGCRKEVLRYFTSDRFRYGERAFESPRKRVMRDSIDREAIKKLHPAAVCILAAYRRYIAMTTAVTAPITTNIICILVLSEPTLFR